MHNHLDHMDIDAISLMKKENMLFTSDDAKNTLLECGVMNYKAFDEGTTVKIGGEVFGAGGRVQRP